jgi:hypothetical protein
VLALQGIFDGPRLAGRQRAQHGAPGRGGVGQRHGDPALRLALHALAVHVAHARAKRAGRLQRAFADVVPVAQVEGHRQRQAGLVGGAEEALQRRDGAGGHGLVVLDQELDVSRFETLRERLEAGKGSGAEAADRHLQARRAEHLGAFDRTRQCAGIEHALVAPQAFRAGVDERRAGAAQRAGERGQFACRVDQQLPAHFHAVGTGLAREPREPRLAMATHFGGPEGAEGNQDGLHHAVAGW